LIISSSPKRLPTSQAKKDSKLEDKKCCKK
jgi:hypothetical protein